MVPETAVSEQLRPNEARAVAAIRELRAASERVGYCERAAEWGKALPHRLDANDAERTLLDILDAALVPRQQHVPPTSSEEQT